MTRLVKCYNLRFKTGVKIFFEEITGIRSQVPTIFTENSEEVLVDFNYFFFLPGASNGRKWFILSRATNST
jgi:hypothetical protein